jgi:hypothetical protein
MKLKRKLAVILCAAILLLTAASCNGENGGAAVKLSGEPLKGNGNIVASELSLSDGIYALSVENISFGSDTSGKITVNESLDNKVLLKTDNNIAETIDISLDGNKIVIKGDASKRYNSTSFEIEIGTVINNVDINGGFDIDFNVPSVTDFTANISGAAGGSMSFGRLNSFTLTVNGAASLNLSGESHKSTVNISGAGTLNAFDFHTVDSNVQISGAANCNIYVTGILDASVSGVGSIVYDGNPETVNSESGITGTIKAR